jgi:hypothetical protein
MEKAEILDRSGQLRKKIISNRKSLVFNDLLRASVSPWRILG